MGAAGAVAENAYGLIAGDRPFGAVTKSSAPPVANLARLAMVYFLILAKS